jgi:hypothetical protein
VVTSHTFPDGRSILAELRPQPLVPTSRRLETLLPNWTIAWQRFGVVALPRQRDRACRSGRAATRRRPSPRVRRPWGEDGRLNESYFGGGGARALQRVRSVCHSAGPAHYLRYRGLRVSLTFFAASFVWRPASLALA